MSECLDDNLALALLDGKLPTPERAAVENHIESCTSCRELVVMLTRDAAVDSQVGLETEASELRSAVSRAPNGVPLMKAGPYTIERAVGSGAAGTVYRAVDETTGEVVALKYVTDPAWRARFRREISTLSRLVHPGIVRYISHGETRSGLYLVMEWLDGEDLAQRIERGPIPAGDVRALGLRLTAALAHAHSVNAVHRDLGPRNVFLPGGHLEQAKLLDFGLVRVPDALDRTGSQAVLGTPQYMAPEQVRDPRGVDARSDIFSLGVVLFEALSGVRPFNAKDLFTVWNNIVGQPAPDLRQIAPTVPHAFAALIDRMLAKDPAQRPQTAAAVHEALVKIDAPLGKSTAPMTSPGALPGPTPVGQEPFGKGTAPMAPQPAQPLQPPLTMTPRRTAPMDPRESRPAKAVSVKSEPAPAPRKPPILVAAAIVAVAILIAGVLNVFGPRWLNRSKPAEAAAKDDRFTCAGSLVDQKRGKTYFSETESASVAVSDGCKAVLEDCVIGGALSVQVMEHGELTLRNCKVAGKTQLAGDAVLTLDGTTLPSTPIVTGNARVVQR